MNRTFAATAFSNTGFAMATTVAWPSSRRANAAAIVKHGITSPREP
jgi:hypothetical protein